MSRAASPDLARHAPRTWPLDRPGDCFHRTPQDLIARELYKKLALPFYPGKYDRLVSYAMLAKIGLGAQPIKSGGATLALDSIQASVGVQMAAVRSGRGSLEDVSAAFGRATDHDGQRSGRLRRLRIISTSRKTAPAAAEASSSSV